ncbi:hypothetical protein AcV7_007041 [Taiwanofungus camphoratus]|nr:hypothetical protein AcV7_007041 [Antrodia cinnamomea]
MAPVRNARVLFNEIPSGLPVPGKTTVYDASQSIDLEAAPLHGGFLVKTLVLSIDPYLRGRMRDASIKSYSEPFLIGEPMSNHGVGVVLRSEHPDITPGAHIAGFFPFQEYAVFPPSAATTVRVLENKERLPWSVYVGVCGMPGQTAHHAWAEFAHPKRGETVFVTAGAGPVGATVIQLAKASPLGLKVIASAGAPDKVAFLRRIGADVAFDYKTERTADVLAREGPIDVFWDNVGGETLEAAIGAAARHARFIECGMISAYNGEAPYPVKNLMQIVGKEITMSGFIVMSLQAKYEAQFHAEMPRLVAGGKVQYMEDRVQGLQEAGRALVDVLTGRNRGKSVVVVAEE